MKKSVFFSLIVATIGRTCELEEFLESVVNQSFSLDSIEVIIVDQNQNNSLDNIIKKFNKKIPNLIHLRSKQVGVSLNRNYGLDIAKGLIYCYPDDDCRYYPDTLQKVYDFFYNNPNVDFALGSVFCKLSNKDVIRRWPKKNILVTKYNFFSLYTMITVFTKIPIKFDVNFGGGSSFGAYEDADFINSHLKVDALGIYNNQIQVMHPELNVNSMSENKIFTYGYGFGAFCRKNYSFSIFLLFITSIIYHFLKLMVMLIGLKFHLALKHKISIFSRIKGWRDFNV